MIDISAVVGFAIASFAVAISPGPSWVYVISATLGQNKRAGLAAMLGNATGILCHVVAATVGLSALLHYSAMTFTVLKWIGALYLIYLAVRTVTQRTYFDPSLRRSQRPLLNVYWDGVLVNVLNPKVSLLMLALLPQLVDPSLGNPLSQTALLGCLHVLIASLVLTSIVYLAHRAAVVLGRSRKIQSVFRWFTATLFCGFGIRLALVERT